MPLNLYWTVVFGCRSTTMRPTPWCASSRAMVRPFRLPPTTTTDVRDIMCPPRLCSNASANNYCSLNVKSIKIISISGRGEHMSTLAGKVAVVTGSSRGIGAAIARLFAQAGAAVAVHGRDEAAISAVQADIERFGGRAMPVVADVTAFDQIEALRQRVEARFGPVDVLVANACGSPSPLVNLRSRIGSRMGLVEHSGRLRIAMPVSRCPNRITRSPLAWSDD